MNKKKYDPDLMLRVQVLEAERRYKSAETWQHRGDWVYKLFCVLFIISASVMLIFNIIYILGIWLNISYINENYTELANSGKQLAVNRSNMTVTAVLSAMIVTSLVFFIIKKFLIPAILSVISAVASNIFFYTLLKGSYESNTATITKVNEYVSKYVIRHLIPAIIFVVTIAVVFLIAFRDKRIIMRQYNKASLRIYDIHHKRLEEKGEEHRLMSPDEWKELVKEYISGDLSGKKKRSQRNKNRKGKAAAESEKSGR